MRSGTDAVIGKLAVSTQYNPIQPCYLQARVQPCAAAGGLNLPLFGYFVLDSSTHGDKSLHVRVQVRKVSCPLSRATRLGRASGLLGASLANLAYFKASCSRDGRGTTHARPIRQS